MPRRTRRPPLAPNAALRYDVVDRIVRRVQPRSVLEIGCGQGSVGARLAGRVGRYLAVEPDPFSFAVARTRIEPAGGAVRNIDHTGLPAGAGYDLVCAFEVLEHIEDDKGALADWVRYVQPGGHLLLSVPAWPERFGPSDTQVGHFRRYTPDQLRDLLAAAGLQTPAVTVYGWPLGAPREAVRNLLVRRRLAATGQTRAERTSGSGRTLQPNRAAGLAVTAAILPFRYLQRLAPTRGTGLVALARKPPAAPGRATD